MAQSSYTVQLVNVQLNVLGMLADIISISNFMLSHGQTRMRAGTFCWGRGGGDVSRFKVTK